MADRRRFENRVMLITGAAGGIGRATAAAAASEGAGVVLLDKDGAAAEAFAQALVSEGNRAFAVEADITDDTAVAAAVAAASAALGPITLLVNNAGAARYRRFEECTPAAWRSEIDLNLTGAWIVTRAVLPDMLNAGHGSIVNVATVNAVTTISEPGYSAAKAGLLQLTRHLAVDYAPRGIRTNAVLPGSIRTPLWDERLAKKPEMLDVLKKWYPVGRVGQPEDVAAAILFLASPEAAFINGASLLVDGGLLAGLPQMTADVQ